METANHFDMYLFLESDANMFRTAPGYQLNKEIN